MNLVHTIQYALYFTEVKVIYARESLVCESILKYIFLLWIELPFGDLLLVACRTSHIMFVKAFQYGAAWQKCDLANH